MYVCIYICICMYVYMSQIYMTTISISFSELTLCMTGSLEAFLQSLVVFFCAGFPSFFLYVQAAQQF